LIDHFGFEGIERAREFIKKHELTLNAGFARNPEGMKTSVFGCETRESHARHLNEWPRRVAFFLSAGPEVCSQKREEP
jgi:hypothetical protein